MVRGLVTIARAAAISVALPSAVAVGCSSSQGAASPPGVGADAGEPGAGAYPDAAPPGPSSPPGTPPAVTDASPGASSGGSSDAGGPSSGGSSDASPGDSSDGSPDASPDGASFASCTVAGGCVTDCSPPASDPLATGQSNFDLYDGCLLAGMQLAGMTDPELGKLTKAQAYQESGIAPSIAANACGGQNCGVWAISAGSITGDPPPGPCGSTAVDPFTGQVDYSHSFGLFQDTPACDGAFGLTSSLDGGACTPTTTADDVPFGSSVSFYCESATSLKGLYIDAVQDDKSPLYAKSVFNPAYQIYTYYSEWASVSQQGNANATGCTTAQTWYLAMAIWNTGVASSSCALSGNGATYVQNVINGYQGLYNKTWPYPFP